jgi:hypothetical protein
MILQPIRRTAKSVTTLTGELLPHLFTLTLPEQQGGCFLLRYSALADSFPLGNMVLYVARTFLFPKILGSDKPTCYQLTKLLIFMDFSKRQQNYYFGTFVYHLIPLKIAFTN